MCQCRNTLLWRLMLGRPLFLKLSACDKATQVTIVMLGKGAADERTSSVMKILTAQRPSLTTHLEMCVRAAEQTVCGKQSLFLDESRNEWSMMPWE